MFLGREEYIKIKRSYSDKTYKQLDKDYDVYSKKKKYCTNPCDFSLAPLPEAVPCVQTQAYKDLEKYICPKQEGKTPMRTYNDAYASANITSPRSDTSVQRDYLLSRLSRAEDPKTLELYKFFNMDVDNAPKTFKELIDAIKNDKFTLDKKAEKRLEKIEEEETTEGWYFGPLYGIVWSGKQPDCDGYQAALNEKDKQYYAAKDIIMTSDATAGLKALQDFEAWLPVTVH